MGPLVFFCLLAGDIPQPGRLNPAVNNLSRIVGRVIYIVSHYCHILIKLCSLYTRPKGIHKLTNQALAQFRIPVRKGQGGRLSCANDCSETTIRQIWFSLLAFRAFPGLVRLAVDFILQFLHAVEYLFGWVQGADFVESFGCFLFFADIQQKRGEGY